MDTDAFDLKEKKEWVGQSLYVLTFLYSLILASDIVIYLFFVIINVNLLKYGAVTAKILQ